jgi:CheY-like chemotaxis protein
MAQVLVVDDEQDIGRAFVRMLELNSHTATSAGSAKEALELCDQRSFDVVILDFIMPGVTGLELLARIRRRQPFVRSILVSGKLERSRTEAEISTDVREAVEADVYFHKPVSSDDLLAAIARLTEPVEGKDWKTIASTITDASRSSVGMARDAAKKLRRG